MSITLLLADRQGNILWRQQGAYSPEKAALLTQAVHSLRTTPVAV